MLPRFRSRDVRSRDVVEDDGVVVKDDGDVVKDDYRSRSDSRRRRDESRERRRREDDADSGKRRRFQPSPSPILYFPWTPGSTGTSASPWDVVAPSPVPVRSSGTSAWYSSSRYEGQSNQFKISAENSQVMEDEEAGRDHTAVDPELEITENMRLEMEYNSDRAWYDREEGGTAIDSDDSFYNEASFQKKEAQLAKRLIQNLHSWMGGLSILSKAS